jgi:CubicO group peptidase (beta-lactamase class C family)
MLLILKPNNFKPFSLTAGFVGYTSMRTGRFKEKIMKNINTKEQQNIQELVRTIESPQKPNRQGLDPFTIEDIMKQFGVPGVSVAVIKDFKLHWAKGYGVADVLNGEEVKSNTLFQAASISKTVAAMAVLKAVQNGLFSLDTDVNTILKSWKLPASEFTENRSVTPRMLTSHTSGLGDGFGFPGYHPSDPLPTTIQILNGNKPSNVGAVFFERPPLTAAKYSGGGATIMQLALTDAVGGTFPEILKEFVLGPIGMGNSSFEQPLSEKFNKYAARAHDYAGQAMDSKWHVYPELAAAGLWTTPTDLAKFIIEIMKSFRGEANNVLEQEIVKEMVNAVGIGDFAIGFRVNKKGEGWYFNHSGGNWGFRCIQIAHKIKGYGCVIMTNADNGHVVHQEIQERIERAYSWDSLNKPVVR